MESIPRIESGTEQEPPIADFYTVIGQDLGVALGHLELSGPETSSEQLAEAVDKVDRLRTARERLDNGDFGAVIPLVARRVEDCKAILENSDHIWYTHAFETGVKAELVRYTRMQNYAIQRYLSLFPEQVSRSQLHRFSQLSHAPWLHPDDEDNASE